MPGDIPAKEGGRTNPTSGTEDRKFGSKDKK
jgi:hypothetical protein